MNKSRRKFLEKGPAVALAAGVGVVSSKVAIASSPETVTGDIPVTGSAVVLDSNGEKTFTITAGRGADVARMRVRTYEQPLRLIVTNGDETFTVEPLNQQDWSLTIEKIPGNST
jgi:hypothetical protein